ncbi:MAG TPA: adenylate/guanylate cyclase domain-containing protein [Candidatus Limnocylindrales bacterium]|nr:adenylate/guanylate cyclase domain-containing protein [Candidatus Limnocylindrales bacterium]
MAGLLEWVGGIGADPDDDLETRRRKALLVYLAVLIWPISVVWGILYLALGARSGAVAFGYLAVSVASIGLFARTRDFQLLLGIQLLDITLAPTLSMWPTGGFLASGAVGLWGILGPMGALVFSSVRSSIRWFVLFAVAFLGAGIMGELTGGLSELPRWFSTTMIALNVVVGGAVVFTLLAIFARQRQDAQDRAEGLLLNILPRSIADKLKANPQTIADSFPSASILFADVADFTPLAERVPPVRVVAMLDQLFGHFDSLAERYAVEKIKTLGDCYMAAAGIPTPRPDHARTLGLMALDMLAAVREQGAVGSLGFELRIGINSGPVVAGVIGRKRFLYDLWGDAVNTAGRMQTEGIPGRVQITRATYELLKEEFVCEPRGIIAVKGKGEMETWYLLGKREALSAEGLPVSAP